MYYIGIDLGTSAVKALLMDASGTIVNVVSREYPLEIPFPGWAQQRPEDWEGAVFSLIPELVRDIRASEVAGIGVGGQMHGLVALDGDDRVIRPAILWNDGRSEKQAERLNAQIGRERLAAWTGNIAFAGFTAPKLLWMRENEPGNFAAIRHILLPKDYIVHLLTGKYSSDYSDASGTLLLDVRNRRWSNEMMQICHVTREQLPDLYESFEVVGTLTADAAKRLGLPAAVRVCAGAGDNAAAAVGTGTVGNGRCNISLGTSGTIFISSETFAADERNALHAFAHADGTYHLMGCMLSAAACNRWWMEKILNTSDFAAEQACITDDMLGRNQVYFLPYLMGERSPHNDPAARGCFIGLSMDTTRSAMVQAILEGVTFGIRDSLEAARAQGVCVRSSKICGGGAKSPLWRRICANILNLPIEIPAVEEGPGMGGAMLAAVACGEYGSVREIADRLATVSGRVLPDAGIAARYERRYQTFRKLYPALKGLFREL